MPKSKSPRRLNTGTVIKSRTKQPTAAKRPGQHSASVGSKQSKIIRLLSDPKGTTIRHLTGQNSWKISTKHDDQSVVALERLRRAIRWRMQSMGKRRPEFVK